MTDPTQELFDVINENGDPTGQVKTRADVHRDGDLHRAIFVAIINSKNEIIIQKRAPDKDTHPNEWDISVAGHISAGQTSLSAAQREVSEELSIKVDASQFELLFTFKDHDFTPPRIDNEIDDVYLVRVDVDLANLSLQAEEVSKIKLIPYADFKQRIAEKNPDFVDRPLLYERLIPALDSRLK